MKQSLFDWCNNEKRHLLEEWHKTKNGRLTPRDIAPMSNKKVWWQCVKGHEWESICK
ncbi:Probable Zinc-ribbon domain-containing protein [Psychrobacillus sp. OK028]|uniref:zinc-ribbon domain-containing protein n=1 Tax=Psychrobacillus sp. OK028 TaxID=1884359 RepID=UPI00088E3C4F|nr:zinc-ribbon domain-containing protein [Psychrobacillus sp. OK028]SDM73852.1 Probable Zinc-ribbon domain-containing protein [Psychrobacillus sp. OK028]